MGQPSDLKREGKPGERLQLWRLHRGMTLNQLAKASGSKPGTISDYEQGRTKKRFDRLPDACQVLGISLQYVRTGKGDPEDLSARALAIPEGEWPLALLSREQFEELDANEREVLEHRIVRDYEEIVSRRPPRARPKRA